MTSGTCQAIYNLDSKPSYHHEFPQFTRLPLEIRAEIWRQALRRNRLIKVDFRHVSATNSSRYTSKNALGKPISGSSDCPMIPGFHIYSKLLRVSHEARAEALRFYRIHLPCRIRAVPNCIGAEKASKVSVVYLNPEYDFLYCYPREYSLVDLFYDMKAYDPRGVGLLNLAVDEYFLEDWRWFEPGHLDAPARAAYLETLSQLHEVFWVHLLDASRANATSDTRNAGLRFNESYPIRSAEPVFQRCHPDPRPIREDLKGVDISASRLRRAVVRWRAILDRGGVRHAQGAVQYRFLVAQMPHGDFDGARDRASAEAMLACETKSWRDTVDAHETPRHRTPRRRTTLAMLQPGAVRPTQPRPPAKVDAAFGFWLFPVDLDFDGEGPPLGLSEQLDELPPMAELDWEEPSDEEPSDEEPSDEEPSDEEPSDNVPPRGVSVFSLPDYFPDLGLSMLDPGAPPHETVSTPAGP